MQELLIVGGWAFWLSLAIAFVAISVALYNESGPGATFVLLLSFVALDWAFGLHLPHWILSHLRTFGLYALLYIGAGIGWSFIKWYFYVLKVRDEAVDSAKRYGKTPAEWHEWVQNHKPIAAQNKALIVLWMSYWIFSVPETLLNDPIRRFFLFVFRQVQGIMQDISDHVFSNVVVK